MRFDAKGYRHLVKILESHFRVQENTPVGRRSESPAKVFNSSQLPKDVRKYEMKFIESVKPFSYTFGLDLTQHQVYCQILNLITVGYPRLACLRPSWHFPCVVISVFEQIKPNFG